MNKEELREELQNYSKSKLVEMCIKLLEEKELSQKAATYDELLEMEWECEKNHKALETATIIGDYKSLKSIPDGCPTKVKVKFKGSDKWIEYKR